MERKRIIQRSSEPPQQNGGKPFGKPEGEVPDLPEDITMLSDRSVMNLFTTYTGWLNYAATLQSEAEVEEARAEAALKLLSAQIMLHDWSKDSVTKQKAMASTTQTSIDAQERVIAAYAVRKTVAVMYANLERCNFLISRELSRRIGSAGVERRNMRWTP